MTSRAKLGVLLACCLVVLGLRFAWVSPAEAFKFQAHLGYAFILGLVAAWLVLYSRVAMGSGWFSRGWLRDNFAAWCVIAAATVFVHLHEPHVMRVLYDEPSHALGAEVMHLEKKALWAGQSNWVGDRFVLSAHYASFRQYLFSFLVSLIHDVTGYRVENVYILNFLLTPIILLNVYLLGRRLAGGVAGLISVGLLATLPLFAQVMCSGSYDGLNLALIGGLIILTMEYAESDGERRLRLMDLSLVTALLLVVARSESILYLIPWGLVTLCLWWRDRRIGLTAFAMVSPLLTLPNLLSNLLTVDSDGAMYSHLRKAGQAFFDVAYLPRHLSEVVYYLFDYDLNCTASVPLSVIGGVGFVAYLVHCGSRTLRGRPDNREGTMALFGVWAAGIYTFVLTQFWSSPIDFMASRFILPLLFVFAVLAGWFVLQFSWIAARRTWVFGVLIIWAVIAAAPASSRAFATYDMTAARSEEWFFEFAGSRDRRTTIYLEKSNVAWVASRYAASCLSYLATSPHVFVRALKAGLYRDVIVCQVQEADPKRGVWAAAPGHELPDNIVLETIEERTMSPIYKARISKLVGYKDKAGALVTPASDAPEVAVRKIETGAYDWYAYWVSLYP